jgi:hypothetical protein
MNSVHVSTRGNEMSGIKLIICKDPMDADVAEVLVDGNVDGKRYRFLLDTGAARTCIELDPYTSLFECIDKNGTSGVFAKSNDDLITVPSVEVGPIIRRCVTVARVAHQGPQTRNLIGMDLLHEFCCHFHFDENTLRIDSNDDAAIVKHGENLYLDKTFHPYIGVEFGPVTANAVWDSGAGITIVDTNFIRKHLRNFQESGTSIGTDSSGSTMETPMFTMSATVIGKRHFPPHRVAGVDLSQVNSTIEAPMDLILGYSTLSKANWIFDFVGRKWVISKLL